MPVYDLLALTPVAASGKDARHASQAARDALDTAHELLDATTPAGDLTTGSTTVLDRGSLVGLLQLIRDDANSAINGAALPKTALHRIHARALQLLDAIGAKPDDAGVEHRATAADPDLFDNLAAAFVRALDVSLGTADLAQRAQVGDWVARARAALEARDAAAARRLLATPYVQTGDTP